MWRRAALVAFLLICVLSKDMIGDNQILGGHVFSDWKGHAWNARTVGGTIINVQHVPCLVVVDCISRENIVDYNQDGDRDKQDGTVFTHKSLKVRHLVMSNANDDGLRNIMRPRKDDRAYNRRPLALQFGKFSLCSEKRIKIEGRMSLRRNIYKECGAVANVFHSGRDGEGRGPIAPGYISYPYIGGNPRPLFGLHLVDLSLHDPSLAPSIKISNNDSRNTNDGSGPQSGHLRFVPAPLALILGGCLIFGASKFLFYSFNGSDYLFMAAFLGGFIPFAVGGFLILCCFLASPPTIFGFTVQHFSLPWSD